MASNIDSEASMLKVCKICENIIQNVQPHIETKEGYAHTDLSKMIEASAKAPGHNLFLLLRFTFSIILFFVGIYLLVKSINAYGEIPIFTFYTKGGLGLGLALSAYFIFPNLPKETVKHNESVKPQKLIDRIK